MQDMTCGDNNRTPVVFQCIGNCRFGGVITKKTGPFLTLLFGVLLGVFIS